VFQTSTEGKLTKSEPNKKFPINTKRQPEQSTIKRDQFNVTDNRRIPFRVRSVDAARISHNATNNTSSPLQKVKGNIKPPNNKLITNNALPKKFSKLNIAQPKDKDKVSLNKLEQRDIKKVIKK